MLVLFLRTFKYIFPYFFALNNECANECARRSFSARDFPSAVDGWLSSHIACATAHHALHSMLPFDDLPFHSTFRPFNNSPFRLTVDSVSVECQRECLSKGKGLVMNNRLALPFDHPLIRSSAALTKSFSRPRPGSSHCLSNDLSTFSQQTLHAEGR